MQVEYALSRAMRPQATSVCGHKLLVYAALSYYCKCRWNTPCRVLCGLKLLVYAAISY
jgi:hypothetical protein